MIGATNTNRSTLRIVLLDIAQQRVYVRTPRRADGPVVSGATDCIRPGREAVEMSVSGDLLVTL